MESITVGGQDLLLPSLTPSLYSPDWQDWTVTASLTLAGYQLWAVEQRVTDRSSTLPVIVVFTGDTDDTISVNRFSMASASLSAGQKEQLWDKARLTLRSSGAKLTQARDEQGWIGLTSLPSLDPNLSIVHLPSGDYMEAAPLLYANINLRRLGLGGRSGLRLTPATPAQQLHLRQSFRLPIPSPSSHHHHQQQASFATATTLSGSTTEGSHSVSPFTETLLALIQLTQHALSLFGLGIVRVPLRSPSPPELAAASEEHADALGLHLPHSRLLKAGDGLLCDTTLAALSYFRFEVAEPLVHLPKGEEAVLSPSLLSVLLSTVTGARAKMAALGEDCPRDPFERRARFLSAVTSFAKNHRLPPTTHLSSSFLTSLSSLHHSHLHPTSTLNLSNQRQKVSRALRTRLDPLGDNGAGGEIETASLEKLVQEIGRGVGGVSIGALWGFSGREGKEGRRERRRESKERARERREQEKEKTDGEEMDERRAGTASEGEALGDGGQGVMGIGRAALKGVRERAGRAGRKFGDNLGFTEAHMPASAGSAPPLPSSATAPTTAASSTPPPAMTKLAPSLVISDSPTTYRTPAESRSSTLDVPPSDPNPLAPSPTNATAATSSSGNIAVSAAAGPSKAAAFAARVASALSSEGAASAGASGKGSMSVSPVGRRGKRDISSQSASNSRAPSRDASRSRAGGLGLEEVPKTRIPPVRRSVTEVAGGVPTLSSSLLPPHTVAEGLSVTLAGDEQDGHTSVSAHPLDDEAHNSDEEVEDQFGTLKQIRGAHVAERAPRGQVQAQEKAHEKRRRRHSFNVVRDAPEPWQNLSRKRLVLDVNLRMTYWTLRSREKKLAEMVEALKTVNSSYEQAIASLQPLLASKTARFDSLTLTAMSLSQHAESYSSASSTLSKLSVGSSRLLYAQSVVEEKLGDVTDFGAIVESKVGQGGTLENGTRDLSGERMGVRKLVKSVDRWREWLAGFTFGGLRRGVEVEES